MRHKYVTRALVLARAPVGETSASLALLTRDMGLVRARAQGVRCSGARLASPLITLAESELMLVRGAEGWRVTGAQLQQAWHTSLPQVARVRATRVLGLALRLVPPETREPAPFEIMAQALADFANYEGDFFEAIECQAVLKLLRVLGLDAGDIPDLAHLAQDRKSVVMRINRGIALSGL